MLYEGKFSHPLGAEAELVSVVTGSGVSFQKSSSSAQFILRFDQRMHAIPSCKGTFTIFIAPNVQFEWYNFYFLVNLSIQTSIICMFNAILFAVQTQI